MNKVLLGILLQVFKTEINKILTDYAGFIVAFVFLIGLVHGLAANWSEVNSREPGKRKEGFINVLYMLGYYAMGIAVIGVAVGLTSKIKLEVR